MGNIYAGISGIDVSSKGEKPYRLFSPNVKGKHRIALPDETYVNTVAEAQLKSKEFFRPAYIFHAVNNALPEAWPDLQTRLKQGDVKISGTESHLFLLADLLNVVQGIELPPIRELQKPLEKPVDSALNYRKTLSDTQMFDDIINYAYFRHPDSLLRAMADVIMQETGTKTREIDEDAEMLSLFISNCRQLFVSEPKH